jgi:hypothetical protein
MSGWQRGDGNQLGTSGKDHDGHQADLEGDEPRLLGQNPECHADGQVTQATDITLFSVLSTPELQAET